jgi:hypothetical protein
MIIWSEYLMSIERQNEYILFKIPIVFIKYIQKYCEAKIVIRCYTIRYRKRWVFKSQEICPDFILLKNIHLWDWYFLPSKQIIKVASLSKFLFPNRILYRLLKPMYPKMWLKYFIWYLLHFTLFDDLLFIYLFFRW